MYLDVMSNHLHRYVEHRRHTRLHAEQIVPAYLTVVGGADMPCDVGRAGISVLNPSEKFGGETVCGAAIVHRMA